MKTKFFFAFLALTLLTTAGCRDDAIESAIGSGPRYPDDEGVATFVSHEKIQIDGKRSYKVTADIESFKSLEGNEITPLLTWKDKYVHVGVDEEENTADWIAGIGLVAPGETALVAYVGVFDGIQKGRAAFADGTTLRVPKGIALPKKGSQVVVEIDAKTDQVVRFRI